MRATEKWAAGGVVRKRLLAAFEANGIEIPVRGRVVLSREPGTAEGGPTADGPESGSAGEV